MKNITKIKCPKCNFEIANFAFKKHLEHCDGTGPAWRKKGPGGKKKCPKCNHEISPQNFSKHIMNCDGVGPKRSRPKRDLGQAWKKGKTNIELFGETKAQLISEKMGESLKGKTGHIIDKKTRTSISKKMMGNTNWKNSVHKSGRGKKGYFKDFYFMSSWELAFIVYCLDHNIEFERNWKLFEYYDENNSKRSYIPDFYMPTEKMYLEIKGYKTIRSELKLKYFPHSIKVLYKKEIQPYLDYVISKYGKNFVENLRCP